MNSKVTAVKMGMQLTSPPWAISSVSINDRHKQRKKKKITPKHLQYESSPASSPLSAIRCVCLHVIKVRLWSSMEAAVNWTLEFSTSRSRGDLFWGQSLLRRCVLGEIEINVCNIQIRSTVFNSPTADRHSPSLNYSLCYIENKPFHYWVTALYKGGGVWGFLIFEDITHYQIPAESWIKDIFKLDNVTRGK